MSEKTVKNIAASVHARLLQQARKDQRPFNELLQYLAMERFLYRWSKSKHVSSFVLKGALMLRIWGANAIRPTRDIDMLAQGTSNDLDSITKAVTDVIGTTVEPDGFTFNADTITAERITENADYEGVRVKFLGNLGNARINMQIDIGFGDMVYPVPRRTDLPSILDFPKPNLLCYSKESSIAEKFQAMVELGDANSRMKDFYDIYTMSRQFDFNGPDLATAIRMTFENRETELPKKVSSFRREFIETKETQWQAFRRKLEQDHIPAEFGKIVMGIDKFLTPVVNSLLNRVEMAENWNAPGPWV